MENGTAAALKLVAAGSGRTWTRGRGDFFLLHLVVDARPVDPGVQHRWCAVREDHHLARADAVLVGRDGGLGDRLRGDPVDVALLHARVGGWIMEGGG